MVPQHGPRKPQNHGPALGTSGSSPVQLVQSLRLKGTLPHVTVSTSIRDPLCCLDTGGDDDSEGGRLLICKYFY